MNNQHKNKITNDSLMNIAYLTQITNIDITNRNPLEYMNDYDNAEFEAIMPSHLLSSDILDWVRNGKLPNNAIDQFIESRVKNILIDLKTKLHGVTFEEMDTMEIKESVTTGQV